jgi:predicted nucleic acid-binding OB-fold protein
MKKIEVSSLVGKNAISMQSGSQLYREIQSALEVEDQVELNFFGVELFASPFFNSSIGFMLKDSSIEKLQRSLSFTNLSDVGRHLLNHVIENAIRYYQDAGEISGAIDSSDDSSDRS